MEKPEKNWFIFTTKNEPFCPEEDCPSKKHCEQVIYVSDSQALLGSKKKNITLLLEVGTMLLNTF